MNQNFSDKDKKDWENFLSSKEKLIDKDNYIKKRKTNKILDIDLHGYTLDDANKKIEEFIKECFENNIKLIKVVTGKGLHSNNERNPYISKDLGILKYSVPEYIKKNTELMKLIIQFKEAPIEDGGEGAFYIVLKKNKIK